MIFPAIFDVETRPGGGCEDIQFPLMNFFYKKWRSQNAEKLNRGDPYDFRSEKSLNQGGRGVRSRDARNSVFRLPFSVFRRFLGFRFRFRFPYNEDFQFRATALFGSSQK